MTTKKFSNALGNISEDYINEAVTYTPKRKKNTWVKWAAIAASLSLIVIGGFFGNVYRTPDTPDNGNNVLSYFAITAHAANGEVSDLLPDGFLSSVVGQQGNMLGVDMPLFHFDVKPSDLKSNEAVYQRFDISISYNGTTVTVTDKDEHIFVAYIFSVQTSQSLGYSIFGWFTEPTDVVVTVTDKESREIVETITVNVNYLADKQEYELKVTNLTTKFAEQKEAVKANEALMSYFFDEGYVTHYPGWFGGSYIDENKLYIKLVSPSNEVMKNISQILAPFDDVIVYKDAEMSITDLQEYADETANALIENGYAVTSWYVNSVNGNIVISVLEKDFAEVTDWVSNKLKNQDFPVIIVEKGAYTTAD